MRRGILGAVAAVALMLAGAPSASAAVTIGADTNAAGPNSYSCGIDPLDNCTYVQRNHPTISYVAPFDGVVVRWRVRGDSNATQFTLRAMTENGDGSFTGGGASEPRSVLVGVENVFDARLPIKQGQYIGLDVLGGNAVISAASAPGSAMRYWEPRVAEQETRFAQFTNMDYALLYNADIEPDSDGDGFGDETQDCNPADPMKAEDCVAPGATITKGPKNKTKKKKKATFEFTGTDTRAIAGFQCKLDTGPFATCTSPHTVKVKKGKHTFQVQAIDQAGNVGSPATDTWKVKKKRSAASQGG